MSKARRALLLTQGSQVPVVSPFFSPHLLGTATSRHLVLVPMQDRAARGEHWLGANRFSAQSTKQLTGELAEQICLALAHPALLVPTRLTRSWRDGHCDHLLQDPSHLVLQPGGTSGS